MTTDNKLKPLREQIDAIDAQILDLLNQRARVAQQVGHGCQVVQRDLGLAGGQRVGNPHAGDETQGVRVAFFL